MKQSRLPLLGATTVRRAARTVAATPRRARARPAAVPAIRPRRGQIAPAAALPKAAEGWAPCHPVILATADPSLTRMLAFALDQARLPHVAFRSGTVLLRELLAMPIGIHPTVVVLDVDLPGVDGHAILERLGVERPNAFLIVVLSSHADESVQVRSLLSGALDHLAKPFNVRVLMAKLLRWTSISARCETS